VQIHPGFPGPDDHAVRWGLYVNYEWSGTKPPDDDSAWTTFATYIGLAVGAYDWTPFVRIIRSAPRWPAMIGVGEAVQWRWKGYEGAYGACTALRAAGGPPYVPLVGTLPGGPQRGPFGPGLLIDPTQLEIHHWLGDPDLPGYSDERHHNLAVLSLPGAPRDQWFALIVTHGSHIDARDQLRHAKALARFGRLPLRVVIVADWNATPSGPRFDVGEFDNPRFHRPPWVIHKVDWGPGPGQAGPYTAATGALDTLVGHWAEHGDDGAAGGSQARDSSIWPRSRVCSRPPSTRIPPAVPRARSMERWSTRRCWRATSRAPTASLNPRTPPSRAPTTRRSLSR
jgi:hypothetical protein